METRDNGKRDIWSIDLLHAVRAGDVEQIRRLVTLGGFDPNTSDKNHGGQTYMHYASASGQVKSIITLLKLGANVLREDHYGQFPIDYSANAQVRKVLYHAAIAERDAARIHPSMRCGSARASFTALH
eukprot:TRINITY_DN12256_c0_g1::TRINITY_DN12256_c0_g1_i1::g.12938::m.12938 TRINITY_DN12256_c0_g1::TRINITY_DN12256_c0_g1_i1::g.12938  ORF type:complete len:128 (+),score=-4.65,sp/Q5F478/ANR44_CHICK/38.36/3e-06,Ank_2/PF12796.2/4.4e-07,Ank/PF00023.25/56,Ank/PF00023.25/0.0077,Ank/PF00023.25/2.5e+03,Ank_4/PF13637.1/0.0018,Ank_4/PF13637.1/3.4,Ank_3/PF13606.1/42,Ank_3/PF13606.1/0.26,Ank_3/PF13606.1/4.3e+03,Ank_5/PF13857.1/4.5e+02,Ank_5/PF13857.1/0.04,Ank_5/PF13857.1/6.9e+03 TRINITY_DN12256_c0_g1_i1:84-467(+)